MSRIVSFLLIMYSCSNIIAQETAIGYISGPDSDNPVVWDFMVTGGRKANIPSKIPVPSNWELKGFGSYNYGHDNNKADEKGIYQHKFRIPEAWIGKRIFIVFSGVMTDTEVEINGQTAGPVHQGGFYPFEYEITDLLNPGQDNLLKVTVSKMSANASINAAERTSDYWVFGGIFRPVYLKAVPDEFISAIAIDAKADGRFIVDVKLNGILKDRILEGEIIQPDGTPLGKTFTAVVHPGDTMVRLSTQVSGHNTWNAESPALYFANLALKRGNQVIHTVRERFGFRTIEVRKGEGIFLNGKRIVLKGCDRHSFRPAKGRALSRKDCYDDVMLIRNMNMNAVRMSHYPPDTWFLDYCDEVGLYVLDELAGWQKPPYDTPTGKRLVKQMVTRDVNHPAILFWDNGNEGGWNTALDNEFDRYDPQGRTVLHPWELFNGVDTKHYPDYVTVQQKLQGSHIFMPTEILHGLYDGGLGAGLDDYWKLMWGNPLTGGMFLWAFADEGVVRTDRNCTIDTDGNHAPDGILGPNHEKEASFFTIREIWSPVYIETETPLPPDFNGRIPVENRFDFTNLNQCTFTWSLLSFSSPSEPRTTPYVLGNGKIDGPDILPHKKGTLQIPLPSGSSEADALMLTASNRYGKEICSWTWKLKRNSDLIAPFFTPNGKPPEVINDRDEIIVRTGSFTFIFSSNGMLEKIVNLYHEIPFGKGPVLVPAIKNIKHNKIKVQTTVADGNVVLTVNGHPDFERLQWTIHPEGWLQLDYRYSRQGPEDYLGISFDFPESHVRAMRWMGNGPYRVWKNRMKGQPFGVWQNRYNHFRPGEAWNYPEFPGYYGNFCWLVLDTDDGPLTFATDREGVFMRLFSQPDGIDPRHTVMTWPEGNISFLQAIPAIGTKFKEASALGPQSQPFRASGSYEGTLYLFVGIPNKH